MRRKGFTLVELLVAISVLAIVAVLGWRGLDTIVRSRVALTRDLEQTRGIQLAFAQLQSDCSRIALPSSAGGRSTLATGSDRVTMVRTVFAENQPSRMQVVAYRLREGQLTRYESAATRDLKELDTMWQAAIGDVGAEQAVLLQSEVASIVVQTWFRDSADWMAANAPPTATGDDAMPVGLRIALQLRGRDNAMNKIFLLGAA